MRSATEVELVLNKYPLFMNRISRRIADNIKEIRFKKEGEKKIKKYGIGYIKVSMKNWLLNDWITSEVEKALLRKQRSCSLLREILKIRKELIF